MQTASLAAVPHVLDDDEVPFVFALGPDHRRALVTPDAEFRRASDRCTIEFPYGQGGLRLRAVVLAVEGGCYITACAGPLLNEWWPLLRGRAADPRRPVLSAGSAGRGVTLEHGGAAVEVHLAPATDLVDMTMAVFGLAGGLTDEVLSIGLTVGLPVIKTALLAMAEYRTLVDPVPAVDVEINGRTVPLSTLLDAAAETADAIEWRLSSG